MRRLESLFALLISVPAVAQFTTVTASVSAIPNATYTFDFVNLSNQPGPPLLGGISVFPTQINGSFDSFGNLSAAVATNGQVLPLPSAWQLNVGITPCIGVHQGFNIQFTSVGSAQDISAQIAAAIPPPPPACSGGGGGGNPAPPAFSVQFNNGGIFGGSARATLDGQGNFKSRSNDGIFNALLSQTVLSPPSNDGIQHALSTSNSTVIVGPDYASTEGIYSSGVCPFYRLAIGCPAPFADKTQLFDFRPSLFGSYTYNPLPSGGTWKVDRVVSNHQTQFSGAGYNINPFRTDYESSGSGKNGFEGGGPDSFDAYFQTYELMTRGITSVMNIEQQSYSLGDNHLYQNIITNNRGTSDASAEGFNTVRNQIGQNLTPMFTTANSTLAAGATLIPGTLAGNVPFIGDGTYYVDATKAGPIFKILVAQDPGATGPGNAGQWTVDATLTPDNIGRVALGVSTPSQYYGATTNETVTVTGLTSAIVTTSTACYADGAYQESARVVSVGSFSGGTQSVTLALRYVHQANAYLTQGSHACNFVEGRANQSPGSPPGRQLFREIGVLSSHVILYSRTGAGHWLAAPSGFFTTNKVFAAGTVITRNGANIASAAVTDPFLALSGDGIILSGCADSSFNGTPTLLSDTGSVVTWSSVGPATTTTCSNDAEIISRLSGTGVREAQEFPGAEIVNTNDPATFALNYNISVEPNTNFQVTAGDTLENHVYHDTSMGLDHSLIDFKVQTSPSIAPAIHFDQLSDEIPEGVTWQHVIFDDPALHYIGLGGTKNIDNTLFDMSGSVTPFLNLWTGLPAPAQTAFNFITCLYGCSDARSQFDWLHIPIQNGSYTEHIHQDTGEMRVAINNGTSSYFRSETSSDLNAVVNSGPDAGILVLKPNQWQTITSTGGGVSSTWTQTAAGVIYDKPITVASCTGCGASLTGSITTTAATTDVVAVTGMTASGHCGMSPTNAAAGTMVQNATPVFIDTFTTNAITLHHVATAGASFSFVCTPN